MPSDAQIATRGKRAQDAVRTTAILRARDAWDLLDPRRVDETYGLWSIQMLDIIRDTRAMSASQAMVTYNLLRPGPAFHELDPGMDSQKILRSLLYTGPIRIKQLRSRDLSAEQAWAKAFQLVGRATTKAVLDAGREITEEAISNDELALGYARVPSPGGCAFCLMLASRGAVYSKDTVLKTTRRSKKRGEGKTFHEGCRCSMFPVFNDDPDLPDIVNKAADLYDKAVKDGAETSTEILAAMRQLGGVK